MFSVQNEIAITVPKKLSGQYLLHCSDQLLVCSVRVSVAKAIIRKAKRRCYYYNGFPFEEPLPDLWWEVSWVSWFSSRFRLLYLPATCHFHLRHMYLCCQLHFFCCFGVNFYFIFSIWSISNRKRPEIFMKAISR